MQLSFAFRFILTCKSGDKAFCRLKTQAAPSSHSLANLNSVGKSLLTDRALQERMPPWGVLVLESHHSPQFTMEWRVHDFVKLVYVLRGRGALEFHDQVFRFQKEDLLVVPPGTENRISDAPDAASSLYVCCLRINLFDFDPNFLSTIRPGTVHRSVHLANRVASQLRRMRHWQDIEEPTRAISMVASALRIMKWIGQQRDREQNGGYQPGVSRDDREQMENYIARLHTLFYEATTIDAAADSIGMSRRAFTRLFQELTGSTWLDYVRRLAIDHAKHQLAQTDLSIASVAFECGFNDLSTFYRQFKSRVGMSPKQYRQTTGMR